MTSFARPTRPPHHARPDHERVVITGMGAITPVGNDLETIWTNLINGVSGISTIADFDGLKMDEFRSCIAGLVKGFDAKQFLNPKQIRRFDGHGLRHWWCTDH